VQEALSLTSVIWISHSRSRVQLRHSDSVKQLPTNTPEKQHFRSFENLASILKWSLWNGVSDSIFQIKPGFSSNLSQGADKTKSPHTAMQCYVAEYPTSQLPVARNNGIGRLRINLWPTTVCWKTKFVKDCLLSRRCNSILLPIKLVQTRFISLILLSYKRATSGSRAIGSRPLV